MRKVEIFTTSGIDLVAQEAQINSWLAAHPRAIVERVLQSESCDTSGDWNLTISIFYNEVVDDGADSTRKVS